ncbi:MAG TPA: UDP-N-acetylmuramoyl-L-alanyl-D-glutamate--2,6-diaminopimelate ligase [Limnochordia bacterium]|nr:UDP-N-acetylmuramoyl-L-alanyl-D-glutamate--2,6-diaminopimelate ligase [Limnochordia bacterium]
MELGKVLDGLEYSIRGTDYIEISGISYDSRTTKPGDLFVAISGMRVDGHDFVYEVAQKGAAALLVEEEIPDLALTQVIAKNTRYALGLVSANFYNHPAQKLRVLGITGTNGKTTSTYLVKSILEQAGYKVGLIGTIETVIGDIVLESGRTTPESLDLQRLFSEMVEKGMDYVVMEVSSHALDLGRTAGISFVGALFTNLSQDHLDFHTTMEEYFSAKAKLFKHLEGPAIINADDAWGTKLLALPSVRSCTYGVEKEADFRAEKIQLENGGVSYILKSEVGQIPIHLKLTGYFNVYNSLGAAALCLSQGVSLAEIREGLMAAPGVPGRFERIENDLGLNVVVDYAHTPHGLENVLISARELTPQGRLIIVFGAGGDRDMTKRPLMGAVAARLADVVILTSDNPRSEDPAVICSSIEKGLLSTNPQVDYAIIVQRRAAIDRAIRMATPDDLVIVAGKGHETYQESALGRIHFDDREEIKRTIKELKD